MCSSSCWEHFTAVVKTDHGNLLGVFFFLTLLYKQLLYNIIILHKKILVGFFVVCVMSQMFSLGLSFCVILCSYGSLLICNRILITYVFNVLT